ncbi:stage II sporulation protein E [Alicyclobacillus cellulosilyticus]|uniref:Stage II sporulation protein E n=1 Tax=Alicyclobacillus cellulosilyticus TaxID=1003997 RepID=A0A917KGE5_9BACL|nr:stage II sporulation protein E [Alicyclobacillus cellulosilyticus]GGJ08997.1 stage II sporulation protein E [Alicyclobacillus cellulosilyticus]
MMTVQAWEDPGVTSASQVRRWLRRHAVWRRGLRPAVFAGFAVLLGHASIAHTVSPFALAYFVVLQEAAGDRRGWPGYFAILGAYWQGGWGAAALLAVEFFLFQMVRLSVFRRRSPDLHWLPFLAAGVDLVCRLAAVGSVWTHYDLIMAGVNAAFVVIVAFIFMQCTPLWAGRAVPPSLRQEQLISLTIFAGSAIAGLAGVRIHGVSVTAVCVDGLILLLAAAGGVGVAAAAGVVIGVLAMLNHEITMAGVAVLCFAGLLAGVLKDAGRLWMGLAFWLSFCLLTAGSGVSVPDLQTSALAAAAATVLFWLCPRRLRTAVAGYVPGTAEHRRSEQERVRRVRSLLAAKVHDVSRVFDELAAAFADTGETPLTSTQQLLQNIVTGAAQSVCSRCPRRHRCWDQEALATYQALVHTVEKIEAAPDRRANPSHDLRERCIRLDPMMSVLRYNVDVTARDARWLAKLKEQRSLISAQLTGVAGVIRELAAEIEKDNASASAGEEQVLAALEQLGLFVDHVHIVSLDPGKVEVEVSQPSPGAFEHSVKVIAPLLSGIVGEHITVAKVSGGDAGPCTSVFTSARVFDVETAVATVARDGRLVSGDSHTAVDLENGRFAVALSDGMGNGERARRESKAAIDLLRRLLQAGFDEKLAVRTVNSTLLLRSKEEMFTTLDMVLIDLFSAKAEFLKVGSAPSFVKRGDAVHTITGSSIPIGILQDIDVQAIEEQLQDGDLLILMSDGVFDAPQQLYDKEEWFTRQIQKLETDDPQAVADTLLECAVEMANGQIQDDMTIVVARVKRHQPEWAAIKLPGITGLRQQERRRGA